MITAPYNFVPLSDKVFFPDWAEQVSHDIPFEDSESGTIDITITAKSPLFIRDHANPEQFCSYNGEYYIPSTSVKGMVRSVLEIMSFSKIPIDNKTHSKTTSVRDMTNRKELVGTTDGCGFLKQNNNQEWYIQDYGKPRTIEYNNRRSKTIGAINCDFETAQEKYKKNKTYIRISVSSSIKDLYSRDNKKIGTKRVATINGNQNNAYLILTGGIDNKTNEFVFADSDIASNIDNIEKAVDKFKKVYFESDSIDGNFWKDNYDPNIGIPIFYKKDGNAVTDIGLSQLFKLAYSYTIDDATKQSIEIVTRGKNKKRYHKLDLAQTIFGVVQEELLEEKKSKKESFALKGRVQFSHFKCDSIPKPYDEVYTVLGSPNPSFYPEYIQQNCKDDGKVQNDKYNTLMDKTSKISGWKRYPLRYGKPKFTKADNDTDSATSFTPLGDYNGNKFNEFTFSGKVRFHNLKKVEIGALISALTFHNNQDEFYHNIGMAKSLGFGKIKIGIDTKPYQKHLIEYEMMMNRELNRGWIETEQIKELFVMAYKELKIDDKLEYLVLDPDKNINKFVDAKNEKINKQYVGRDCLPKVSKLFAMQDNYPKSLLTDEVLEEIENEKIKNKQKKESTEEWNRIIANKKYLSKERIEKFIGDYPNSSKINDAKNELELLINSKKPDTNISSIDTLNSVEDSKKFKSILEENKDILDTNMETIKDNAIRIYKSLKGKKQKNFFKEIQLGRFLGEDFEDKVKKLK